MEKSDVNGLIFEIYRTIKSSKQSNEAEQSKPRPSMEKSDGNDIIVELCRTILSSKQSNEAEPSKPRRKTRQEWDDESERLWKMCLAEREQKKAIAEEGSKIDASDLTVFLADISTRYEDNQNTQLMQFEDYFARAFSSISSLQFPWTSIIRQSGVEGLIDMPLSYISKPVYKTSARWISKLSAEALDGFFSSSLNGILADFLWSALHVPPKAQLAVFVVLAMILRRKPDVLISQLRKWRDDPDHGVKYKFPVYVWVICQATKGDLDVGLYSWARILLPVVSREPHFNLSYVDLALQLVERILFKKNGAPLILSPILKGERVVPPVSLVQLMRVAYPPPESRVEEPTNKIFQAVNPTPFTKRFRAVYKYSFLTRRFQQVYPTLKELALAGSPKTKAIKRVSLELLPITVEEMLRNRCDSPELSEAAADIFIWCLVQNIDSYKQWEKLHMENDIEASVVTSMEMLAGYDKWRIKKKIKLTPLDNMKATLENLRQKIEQSLATGEAIAGRLTRCITCVKSGGLGLGLGLGVLTLTIVVGAILFSP